MVGGWEGLREDERCITKQPHEDKGERKEDGGSSRQTLKRCCCCVTLLLMLKTSGGEKVDNSNSCWCYGREDCEQG